jgi:hypothetical protein
LRTLDQNRSKIKEEIVAALGEPLAEAYLFEATNTRMRPKLRRASGTGSAWRGCGPVLNELTRLLEDRARSRQIRRVSFGANE